MTELFEKYYQNKLSASERLEFDQKLKSDTEFAQDYETYVMMMDYMDSKDDINNALNNLNEVHEELKKEEPPKNKNQTTIFRFLKSPIAAVFILFMGVALFYLYTIFSNKIDNPQELFATHFTPASISLTTKGIDSEKILAQINLDYNANKHKDVINALDQINIDSLNDNRLYLMLGSSYIAIDSFSQARAVIKPLEQSIQFRNEFYWFTGMSFLGENDGSSAQLFLNSIPKSSNYFSKAQTILSNLNQTKK